MGSGSRAPRPFDHGSKNVSAPYGGSSSTVHAGWLIDGSGGPVRRQVRLDVQNGVINTVRDGSVFQAGASKPRSAEEFDFSGCTLMPGLIDSHVHLAMSGDADESRRRSLREAPYEIVRQTIVQHLQEHLRHGVIGVRDGGGCRGSVLRFAKSQAGQAQRVRVQAAGRAWHRAGRYGRLIGRPPAGGHDLAEAIRKDPEPADHIKIVNSGLNSLSEYGRQTAPQFDLTELSAAVRAAAGRGLSVMVHANGEAPVSIAAGAGCRSVEHGFFMGLENLARMAEQGITWVPTVVTMEAYAEVFTQAGKSPDVARRTLDHQIEQLAVARRLGVNVALGTDAGTPGVPHGAAVIAEMKLLLQAGFTLAEAVRCASQNAARLTGCGGGLIDCGRPATFIAVEGDPSGLPEALGRIRAVFIRGERLVDAG